MATSPDSVPQIPHLVRPASQVRRLNSWKEIAAFFDRDVRTVQLWEKKESLPVRRHTHRSRSCVYAYAGELEAWQRARTGRTEIQFIPGPTPVPGRLATLAGPGSTHGRSGIRDHASGATVPAVAEAHRPHVIEEAACAHRSQATLEGISPDGVKFGCPILAASLFLRPGWGSTISTEKYTSRQIRACLQTDKPIRRHAIAI